MSELPVQQIDATDWTGYYEKPFFFSRVTRAAGGRRLIRLLQENGIERGASFLELGGGNSCIFQAIEAAFSPSRYGVVDANELGLRLFQQKAAGRSNVVVDRRDLLNENAMGSGYDVVMSIGLIEHFDRQGTRTVIGRHFAAARSKGYVLITFPTPTRVYRISRGTAEFFGMWNFPDERPLSVAEVRDTCEQFGTVTHSSIGSWTPFTQAVVLTRKF